jgi:hypothetical protein
VVFHWSLQNALICKRQVPRAHVNTVALSLANPQSFRKIMRIPRTRGCPEQTLHTDERSVWLLHHVIVGTKKKSLAFEIFALSDVLKLNGVVVASLWRGQGSGRLPPRSSLSTGMKCFTTRITYGFRRAKKPRNARKPAEPASHRIHYQKKLLSIDHVGKRAPPGV